MADKNTLRKMSQDVLVIPFSEEEAETLDRFCQQQVEEITQERLETLILSFLTRKNDRELMEAFEAFCKEVEYGKELSRPAILFVLAEYIAVRAVENVKSNEESALFSLLLKNALILAVKGNGFVAYPKAISETFGIYYDHIEKEKTFGRSEEDKELIQMILDPRNDSLAETIEDAASLAIKSIAYDAATLRYENMTENIKIDVDDLVEEVYNVVRRLVEDSPWVYVDRKPADTIKNILGNACNTALLLSDVIEKLKVKGDEEVHLPTSILLRLISGDGEDIELNGDSKFTAAELAVYLYYELLAETISKDINVTEE